MVEVIWEYYYYVYDRVGFPAKISQKNAYFVYSE